MGERQQETRRQRKQAQQPDQETMAGMTRKLARERRHEGEARGSHDMGSGGGDGEAAPASKMAQHKSDAPKRD